MKLCRPAPPARRRPLYLRPPRTATVTYDSHSGNGDIISIASPNAIVGEHLGRSKGRIV